MSVVRRRQARYLGDVIRDTGSTKVDADSPVSCRNVLSSWVHETHGLEPSVAVRHSVDAHTLGIRLARVFSNDPNVLELWIEPDHEEVVFWLVTEPVDADTRRALHGASLVVYDEEEFADAMFEIHILSPTNYPEGYDLHDSIPASATRIDLSPHA